MKKLLKSLFLILGLVVSVTAMTACSDDDEGGLSGVYGRESSYGYGDVYHFTNGNTVVYYGSAHYGQTNGNNGMLAARQQIGSSNWYACEGEPNHTYTYVEEDNKIIIPMKGVIMTKSGKNLIEDGGGTFTKD